MSTSSSATTATDCKASAAASAAKPGNTADGTSKATMKRSSADKLPALKDCEQKITELRKLRHSYAQRMARNLRVLELTTKRLMALHKLMDREAKAIAGKDYAETYELVFFEVRSLPEREDDGLETFAGEPGLRDILPVAIDTARLAAECAASAEPPALPCE